MVPRIEIPSKAGGVEKSVLMRLGKAIMRSFLESEIATGQMDPTDENLRACCTKLLKETIAGTTEFRLTDDFTSHLLKLARQTKEKEEFELSCLYYAIWIEHLLNRLIHDFVVRHRGSGHYAEILMKDSSIRGKMLWLYFSMAHRPIPTAQLNKLTALSERRNQFVHYKWSSRNADAKDDHCAVAAKSAESFVQFLQRFERKHFFSNKKSCAVRLLSNPAAHATNKM